MGIGHERFEDGGNVLNWHLGRGYTGGRRSPTLERRYSGNKVDKLVDYKDMYTCMVHVNMFIYIHIKIYIFLSRGIEEDTLTSYRNKFYSII